MITGSFSNKDIMQAIEDEIDGEIVKVQFSAVVFKELRKLAFTVGLFINGEYILEEDIFETNTQEELMFKMKEISNLIYKKYGVKESTYNIDYEGRPEDNIYDEKVC